MTEKTLREQLEAAYEEHTETAQDPADVEEPEVIAEEPTETTDIEAVESEAVVEEKPAIDAPQSWTAESKAEWASLSPKVQAEIIKRENDTHKMFTSREGELRLGKDMKEVIDPYMSVFRETNTEPKAFINELLGTVNTLRNGTEEQKLSVMRNIAQGYGVDLNKVIGYQQNPINNLYGEINALKQQMNPQSIINQLQEQQESARIQSEVNAFAANPANKHFETVKAFMAPLLSSGQAKDLQEAYDTACWANPTIRSTMLNTSKEAEAAKRKADIASKKNASVSVKGSPSSVQGNASSPDRTLREELAANMASALGSKI